MAAVRIRRGILAKSRLWATMPLSHSNIHEQPKPKYYSSFVSSVNHYNQKSVLLPRVSVCGDDTTMSKVLHFHFSRISFLSDTANGSDSDCSEHEQFEEIDHDRECSGDKMDEGLSGVDFAEVDRVFKVVEELFASDKNMEAVLDQCDIKLSHLLVCHVLKRFSHARKPAFRFFNWAGQQQGYSHNSVTYNAMMCILARTRQYVTMCELLEEMGRKGNLLNLETFEIAIKGFAFGREFKKAVQIFSLMKKHGFDADTNTFNVLLGALSRAKLAKEANVIFQKMEGTFIPDGKTYSVLISAWCKVKNLKEAGKLWNQMVDKGFRPDLVAHNIMLEGLFNARREEQALKFFDLMKANGVTPNHKTYTVVIHGLSNLKKMDLAMRYFAEMQENDCAADAAVYTCLIKGFGIRKRMNCVYQLLQEMRDRGIPFDCQIYNALIKIMLILRKPEEATKLFDEMIQDGHRPSIHTYNMLMKLYFCTKRPEMGFAVWDQMAKDGCCPDYNSYTVFISGLIREGRSQEACTYIESMIEKGMKAPRFNTNKFLADFSKAGRPDIYEELAEKMRNAGKLDMSDIFLRFSRKMKKRVRINNA